MRKLLVFSLSLMIAVLLAAPALSAEKNAPEDPSGDADRYGFAKYVPSDVVSYLSIRGGRDIVREIGQSTWWKKLLKTEAGKEMEKLFPVLKMGVAGATNDLADEQKKMLESGFSEIFSHDVCVAIPDDYFRNAFVLFDALTHAAFVFEPEIIPANDPRRAEYTERAVSRMDRMLSSLKEIKLPPYIIAFKMKDRKSVNSMLSFIDAKIKDDMILSKLYSVTDNGFAKISLTLGDVLTPDNIKKFLAPLSVIKDTEAEKNIIKAIRSKTVGLYWGYAADYLVVVFAPDDSLVKFIDGNDSR